MKLVQCVFVRSDLVWNAGALVAQACHATSAVNHARRVYSPTQEASVKIIQVPGEAALQSVGTLLEQQGIHHKMWIEQPENIITCACTEMQPEADWQRLEELLKASLPTH
ncbi:putative peptidyl-tRNA hydrolase PTRHD1 [Phlebotomus argentipes]|uniref:putative peptidyl-tRNA hydrolase PTRHD1 n=1 Tax=Phlebotomus argentipes TaxID=94469 RepID=UPI002892D3D6|nr:putative peptidyl-tRNA hydrolase PTRHD1 [Phlebotomus argentipes]